MTLRFGRTLMAAILVIGVAVAAAPAAQAAERVKYHGKLFYDLFEVDEVRAKFRRESGLDPR
ncbi:MAG: hypothetical protein HOH89_07490, partial [Alphaproteobacteria bacterium]|nr:hypothetical protein [Alphaproteobacteria bacterium]